MTNAHFAPRRARRGRATTRQALGAAVAVLLLGACSGDDGAGSGTTSASYETTRGTPEQVLESYDENLPDLGWTPADPVVETSDGVWRGDWLRDGRRLQVSALHFDNDEGDDGVHTQFSLVLLDSEGDIEVGASVP